MKDYISFDGGTRDFGVLSDASKSLNQLLGDTSGRTVSMRTAQGFKEAFGANISDDAAEDIVHAGMVASAVLLKSESDGAKLAGLLLTLGLVGCYHEGK